MYTNDCGKDLSIQSQTNPLTTFSSLMTGRAPASDRSPPPHSLAGFFHSGVRLCSIMWLDHASGSWGYWLLTSTKAFKPSFEVPDRSQLMCALSISLASWDHTNLDILPVEYGLGLVAPDMRLHRVLMATRLRKHKCLLSTLYRHDEV